MESQPPTPPTVVIQQRDSLFGRFGKVLIVLLVLCVLSMMGMASSYQRYFGEGEGPTERYHSLSKEAERKIAILTVTGAILESDDHVEKQIKRIEGDPDVVAVVMRINSPGGTVTYSDPWLHLRNRPAMH